MTLRRMTQNSLLVISAAWLVSLPSWAQDPPDAPPLPSQKATLTSSPTRDQGPADRYELPYAAIVYGRAKTSPLANLTFCLASMDWDGDGLTDLLASERRGGGLKLYRNVGETGRPIFIEPRYADRLLERTAFGGVSWFAPGRFNGQQALVVSNRDGLAAIFNDGSHDQPIWRRVPIHDSADRPWKQPKRFAVGDITGDGRDDLVFTQFDESKATDLPKRGKKTSDALPHAESGESQCR